MFDPFAMALGALFAGPGSVATVYVPRDGVPTYPRGIWQQPTGEVQIGDRSILTDVNLIQYQVADVPVPAKGDRVTIASRLFEIDGEPRRDVEGLTWTCALTEL